MKGFHIILSTIKQKKKQETIRVEEGLAKEKVQALGLSVMPLTINHKRIAEKFLSNFFGVPLEII